MRYGSTLDERGLEGYIKHGYVLPLHQAVQDRRGEVGALSGFEKKTKILSRRRGLGEAKCSFFFKKFVQKNQLFASHNPLLL